MAKNTKTLKPAGRAAATGQKEQEERKACTQPKVQLRPLPDGLTEHRARLIRVHEKKWVNGTVLHFYFYDRNTDGPGGRWVGAAAQKEVVRRAFQAWKELPIGLEFQEVANREEAEVRIGFDRLDGSWSYVGRDVIDLVPDPDELTMNFGWDLTTDYGWDTALHEIGHTLGLPHEHQNPNAGIVWDEAAVYRYFRGSPNFWDDDTIRWNILRKLLPTEVEGSDWDRDSIMHYGFPAGLIRQPADLVGGFEPEPGLSETDIEEVRGFYPALEEVQETELRPFESQRLLIEPGQQRDFRIRPEYSKRYTIQTFGTSDTVIVLFERAGDELRYIDGDDDSGYATNARIRERLYRGREYVLRVRLYYADIAGQTAVFLY